MRREMMMAATMLLTMTSLLSCATARASDITVSATSSDIREQLDLRAVATLFARSSDLEEFEQVLNDPDSAFSNLDLNSDGVVDYLRVVETTQGNKHLIVLQAILAKDVYQDVATIEVSKDEASGSEKMVIRGDVAIYGDAYIVEPTFYYRPVIYDWFWAPHWVAWHSPFYWDYYPGWWHPYCPVTHVVYVERCHHYCHHHNIGSYHVTSAGRPVRQAVMRPSAAERQAMVATRPTARSAARPVSSQKVATTEVRPAADRTAATARPATTTATARPATTTATARPATTTRRADMNARTFGSTAVTSDKSAAARTTTASNRTVATTNRTAATTTSTGSNSSSTTRSSYSAGSTTTRSQVSNAGSHNMTTYNRSASMSSPSMGGSRSAGMSAPSAGSRGGGAPASGRR